MSSQQVHSNQTTYEMKDSGIEWMGHIPSNWEVVKLNSKYKFHTGFTPDTKKPEFYDDNGFNWVTISDLNKSKIISDTQKRISELGVSMTKGLLTPKGSLLYSFKLSVGQVGIAGEDLYTNEAIASFVPQKNECLNFLYYSSQVCIIKNAIENIYGAKLLNQELIKSAKIVVPPIYEQEAIANYLDEQVGKIDELISDQKVAIEQWKAYKQSLITETVTKGLNPDVEMKDSGIEWIGEIPKDWALKKLKYLFVIKKDIAGTTGFDILSVTQNGIKIKDITTNEGQISNDYSKYQLVNKGDFVMNHMDLLTGWVDYSNYDGVTSPDYRVFKLKELSNCSAKYYLYIMQMCYKNKIFYGLGQGVSNLGRWRLQADKFLNFFIPIPPLYEQQAIADYLDEKCSKIDQTIEQKQVLIKQLEEYKQSLIYECVTGKRRVL